MATNCSGTQSSYLSMVPWTWVLCSYRQCMLHDYTNFGHHHGTQASRSGLVPDPGSCPLQGGHPVHLHGDQSAPILIVYWVLAPGSLHSCHQRSQIVDRVPHHITSSDPRSAGVNGQLSSHIHHLDFASGHFLSTQDPPQGQLLLSDTLHTWNLGNQ